MGTGSCELRAERRQTEREKIRETIHGIFISLEQNSTQCAEQMHVEIHMEFT